MLGLVPFLNLPLPIFYLLLPTQMLNEIIIASEKVQVKI